MFFLEKPSQQVQPDWDCLPTSSLDTELFLTRWGASGKQGLRLPHVFSSHGLASWKSVGCEIKKKKKNGAQTHQAYFCDSEKLLLFFCFKSKMYPTGNYFFTP